MFVLKLLFWISLIYVSYIQLIYILFKGKQCNRFFGTFLNTVVPIIGSVPTYIVASKYEKRIGGIFDKINRKTIRYAVISLQLLSVLCLFIPFFSTSSGYISGINLVFGKSVEGNIVRPTLVLVYIVILPVLSAVINYFYTKSNVTNFITYVVSLVNILSMLMFDFVIGSNGANATVMFWLYNILNTAIMLLSIYLMVICRDKFLFKLEYDEKIEHIKEEKKKTENSNSKQSDSNTYKCAKCGNFVKKGTICSCIESKKIIPKDTAKEGQVAQSPDSYCVYCKKPLGEGEICNCQGEGFGITIKNELSKDRKCMYCGQLLVGESTCVCEKIMKNSEPLYTDTGKNEEPKKYFESHVEKSSSLVADELAELEKKINSRFELVKENMELTSKE